MRTLKFKLYNHKRNRYLKRKINVAGIIYNHCIALHKRYYRMWRKHLNCAQLQKHIAKIRRRTPFWQQVGSQAVQDICQRIEKGYQFCLGARSLAPHGDAGSHRFFKHHVQGVRPPNFRKVKKYKSFTLKQAGYKFLDGNRIKIGNRVYQFWKSQEIEGKVKTLTVKRTPSGEIFLAVVVDSSSGNQIMSETGKSAETPRRFPAQGNARQDSAGFDFGLKNFLTCSEGFTISSPLFFQKSLKEVQKASKALSTKVKGSKSWHQARLHLARCHEKIVNRRRDWFWKLAHQLTNQFDVLCFETLNLKGMQRLWGRKVNDLGFREFLQILKWVATKKRCDPGEVSSPRERAPRQGKKVTYIDQWYPSSKTCNHCGHVLENLDLDVRRWRCPSCQTHNDRDEKRCDPASAKDARERAPRDAAKNIKMVGVPTIGLGDVRQAQPAIPV